MCEEDVFGTDYSYSDNSYTFDSWSECGESHHPYSREEVFEINHNARLDHDSQTIIHYDAYDSIDLNPQPGIKTIINFHDTTQLKNFIQENSICGPQWYCVIPVENSDVLTNSVSKCHLFQFE